MIGNFDKKNDHFFLSGCIECFPHPFLAVDLSAHVVLANTAAHTYFSAFTTQHLLGTSISSLFQDHLRTDFTGPAFLGNDLHACTQSSVCEAVNPANHIVRLTCSRLKLETFPHHAGWIIQIADPYQENNRNTLKVEDIQFLVHDLRAPLSNIVSLIELERAQRTSSSSFLAALEAQADHGLALSQHFLQMAKSESERIDSPAVDLSDLLRKSLSHLQLRAEQKQIHLQLERLPPALPFSCGDAGLIRRAFDNILDNAIKYSPPASTVRCAISATDEGWSVEFSDQGAGLTPSQIEDLFQPFARFHQATHPESHGFGLGLAFVQRVMTACGGRVEVDRTTQNGSKFLLIFPRIDRPDAS